MKIRDIYKLIHRSIVNIAYPENSEGRVLYMIKRHLVKQRLDEQAYQSSVIGVQEAMHCEEPIVVSLTTHGKRIMTVHRAVESLLQQSVKPNRIVLYIGENEYQSIDQLPVVLQRQVNRGLEIRFVQDIGPLTKLLPALREFPEASIITVDDDNFYPVNTIERLLAAHKRRPDAVCGLAVRVLEWKKAGKLKPYNMCLFAQIPQDTISPMYVAEGCGGVLYPPHSLSETVFDVELYKRLTPYADDFWFKAMAMVQGTPVLAVGSYFYWEYERYYDDDVQDIGLAQRNLCQNENEKQLQAVFTHFDLYSQLAPFSSK